MDSAKQLWPVFVALTILSWGAYVPTIHHGQRAFGSNSALRAFMFVGVAYFVMAGAALAYAALTRSEPLQFTRGGVSVSTLAGVLGALGALGVVFALKNNGHPLVVAPLVFAGAPVVNTFVSMMWDKPSKAPGAMFYLGILLACAGAAIVLRFKPT